MINLIFLSVAAYLIGSVPFSILITRLFVGYDVREGGSGHAGATNTMRQAGWGPGILVLILDIGKGMLAAWLSDQFIVVGINPVVFRLAAAAAVVAGHCWPIYANFRGGMGLATGGGVLLYTWPLGFVTGVGLAAASQLVMRHSARGNVLTGVLLTPLWAILGAQWLQLGVSLPVGLLIALRATSDWNRKYRELWFDRES